MRKALIVGIDYYAHVGALHGCVNDAYMVRAPLERHSDGTPNFDVRILTATNASDAVDRDRLRAAVEELFRDDSEVALFYFAGHGYVSSTGGYLVVSDSKSGHDSLALADILTLANRSAARNKIILLDSCHSGIAGSPPSATGHADLSEGLTILTGSTADQYASEKNGAGVFTTLLVDALNGGAANLVGDITPGSVYAYIDKSLGAWEQRPIFKTNVKHFVSLRKTHAPIPLADIHRLTELFPQKGFQFNLDPTYEPERGSGSSTTLPDPIPEHTEKFAILQRYNRVNLVVPVGAPHMWHAAMQSKACKLTVLGEHYRSLVEKGRI